MDNNQEKKEIQIELSPEMAEGVYSNLCYHFTLVFRVCH